MTPVARFCYLKDQKPISQEAYQQARSLCDRIRFLIAGRDGILQGAGRSPEIHLPHADWQPGGARHDGYRAVADGDYAVVNHLRLFSQTFTGRPLLSLSGGAVPSDADDRLAERAAGPSPEVDAYADRIAHLPEVLHVAPPNVFGEVGWLVNGKIVNPDALIHLEHISLLAESGKLWELRNRTLELTAARKRPWARPRVLEIGAGYGGLAHHLMTLVPQARYFLVDVPESLLFAAVYLSTLWPASDNVLVTPDNLADLAKDTPGFTFVPNFLFDDCCAGGAAFDLVINTHSMSDMSEKQVRYYCKGVSRLLGRRGVFFEQNAVNAADGALDVKSVLANFFRLGLPLRSPAAPTTQGPAHLWADAPVKPYAWLPTNATLEPAQGSAYTPLGEYQPRLVEEGVHGFNVIHYRGAWYALPQGAGPFDPRRVEDNDYPKLFTADTKEQLKRAIRAGRGWAAGR